MGRLVPAGTGNPRYRDIRPVVEGGYPPPSLEAMEIAEEKEEGGEEDRLVTD